jgi:hypothetical protein
MKTSKIILVAVACFIIILLITMLLLIKYTLQPLQIKAGLKHNYKAIPADNFQKLDFSSHFIITIKQGKECKAEMAFGEDSVLTPTVKNLNGTLYFKVDSTVQIKNSAMLYVRITMPLIKEIRAERGAKINLENFQSDSLNVVLENGVEFTGKDNHFKYLSFKTPGNSWLQFKNTY